MAFIRKRPRKDGTVAYVVQWVEPGTGKQTTRTLATEPDARELADFLNANGQSFALAAQAAAKLRSTAPTVAEIVAAHIDQLTSVRPDTRAKYERIAARHITPHLGAVPVDTLTRRDVAAWMNNLDGSAKTKRNIQSILSAALTTAAEDGIITANVAKGVQPPKGDAQREAVFLTREELETITTALPPRYQLLVRFLALTGTRWGEATALDVRDITLTIDENGAVTGGSALITKAWKTTPQGQVLGAPKTRRGRRTITLPRALAVAIAGHIANAPDRGELQPGDLLFTNAEGRQVLNWAFHGHVWGPTLNKVTDQLRHRPRIHDLRHTHASWLIAAGVPLTVIQRRLGHESIKTTSDLYGHLADDADAQAAAALD